MKLDDIPAEAWRRAVEAKAVSLNVAISRARAKGIEVPFTVEMSNMVDQIKAHARRIAAEMAEPRTPPCSENGGG